MIFYYRKLWWFVACWNVELFFVEKFKNTQELLFLKKFQELYRIF